MPSHPIARLSARFFSAMRRVLARSGDWIVARPGLAVWFFPDAAQSADEQYRAFNGRYFASFHQQERMLADQPRMKFYQDCGWGMRKHPWMKTLFIETIFEWYLIVQRIYPSPQ